MMRYNLSQVIVCCLLIAICIIIAAIPAAAMYQISKVNSTWTIENDNLLVTVRLSGGYPSGGFISVKDKANNYVWTQPGSVTHPNFTSSSQITNGIQFYSNLPDPVAGTLTVKMSLTVDSASSRQINLTAEVSNLNTFTGGVDFIEPFAAPNTSASRIAITDWFSGHLYPTNLNDANWPVIYISDYDVSLLQLPWSAVLDLNTGCGYSVTVDTPDNAVLQCRMFGSRRAPQLHWRPMNERKVNNQAQGIWGENRQVTFTFTATGGYVSLLKTYRNSLPNGILKTLAEKKTTNPNIAKLIGAPHLWDYFHYIDAAEAYTIGVTKARHFVHTWGYPINYRGDGAGDAQRIAANHALGWLTEEYNCFADAYQVATEAETDWVHEINSKLIKDFFGNLMPGWADSNGQQYMRCSQYYLDRISQWIPSRQQTYPISGVYIDVTPIRNFYECFDSAHPRTRTQYKNDGTSILQYAHDNVPSGKLVTSGEGGKWLQVPYLDAPLGLMSCLYLPWLAYSPDTYRQTTYVDTNVTVAKWDSYENYGSLGHKYRAPLWELVFHDCVVSDWYPNDAVDTTARTTGLPYSFQKKKDAINVLYGAVPTFYQAGGSEGPPATGDVFGGGWYLDRAAWMDSYRNACKPHEMLGDKEMLTHAFVSGTNYDVQKTTWSDGTIITVNFGTTDYLARDRNNIQFTLRQFDFLVDGNGWKTVKSWSADESRSITVIQLPDYYFSTEQVSNNKPVPIALRNVNESTLRVNVDDNGSSKTFMIYPLKVRSQWYFDNMQVYLCDAKDGHRIRQIAFTRVGDGFRVSAAPGWNVIDAVTADPASLIYGENIALTATASVSSSKNGTSPALLNNGLYSNSDTSWQSDANGNYPIEWVQLNWETPQTLNTVRAYIGAYGSTPRWNNPTAYALQTSDDGTNWKDVRNGSMLASNFSTSILNIVLPQAVTTQHLRLRLAVGDVNWSLYVQEFEAYNYQAINFGIVTGKVKTDAGVGIPNATVSVFLDDGAAIWKEQYVVDTDAYGNFVSLLPSGSYTLRVSAAGYNNNSVLISLDAGQKLNQNIQLTPGVWSAFPAAQWTAAVSSGLNLINPANINYKYTQTTAGPDNRVCVKANNSPGFLAFGLDPVYFRGAAKQAWLALTYLDNDTSIVYVRYYSNVGSRGIQGAVMNYHFYKTGTGQWVTRTIGLTEPILSRPASTDVGVVDKAMDIYLQCPKLYVSSAMISLTPQTNYETPLSITFGIPNAEDGLSVPPLSDFGTTTNNGSIQMISGKSAMKCVGWVPIKFDEAKLTGVNNLYATVEYLDDGPGWFALIWWGADRNALNPVYDPAFVAGQEVYSVSWIEKKGSGNWTTRTSYLPNILSCSHWGSQLAVGYGANGPDYIRSIQLTTITLSGKVNLLNYAGDITNVPVTVELGNGIDPITLNLDVDGNFTIDDIPIGTYDVRIKASHWLAKLTSGIVISGNSNMGTVDLINGDVVDSNEVDFSDINTTRAAYGSFPGDETWNERADVDGSGEVDFTDINIVRSNYGEIGD